MIPYPLTLQPFPGTAPDLKLTLICTVFRYRSRLSLKYELQGDLSPIAIDPPAEPPTRRDNLWETTCLECFCGIAGEPTYWEVNLSPAGHWNVYRFDDYRQGMRPEPGVESLPFEVQARSQHLELTLNLDLDLLNLRDRTLDLSVTAVIQPTQGEPTYWALKHCRPEPDFHCRESFGFTLPA